MSKPLTGLTAFLLLLCYSCMAQEQTSAVDQITNFPTKFFNKVQSKASNLDDQLTRQTEKYMNKLARQESKLRAKWLKQDSAAAARFFAGNPLDYSALAQKLRAANGALGNTSLPNIGGSVYLPNLDSIKTSLKFLQQNKTLLASGAKTQAQVTGALSQVNQLQSKIQVTEQIRNLLRQRQQQLRQALSQYPHLPTSLQNSFKGYSQQAYYYGAQLKAYRDELSDPDKLTKQALGILGKQPIFQNFMQTHSDLAGFFSLPAGTGGGGGVSAAKALPGLQTRAGIQQILHAQLAAGNSNASQMVSQQVSLAQSQLRTLKNKVASLGGGNSNMDIPEFRPNGQHVKPFLNRLTYGFNIQSARSTYYFPTTTDIGLSLGYKLNDGNTIGIGASYKMGWGQDIKHIAISSQGIGLRSYLDMKIKGSFFATGGLEYNYQQPFYSFAQIRHLDAWTRSGLIGITKKYKISNKMQGNLQLLWDFLSYEQVPKTAPILIRLGYTF